MIPEGVLDIVPDIAAVRPPLAPADCGDVRDVVFLLCLADAVIEVERLSVLGALQDFSFHRLDTSFIVRLDSVIKHNAQTEWRLR